MNPTCVYCAQSLRFDASRGWVHPEGGTYVMRCMKCLYTGAPYPSPSACPGCGAVREWRDDHCATPNRSDTARDEPLDCSDDADPTAFRDSTG